MAAQPLTEPASSRRASTVALDRPGAEPTPERRGATSHASRGPTGGPWWSHSGLAVAAVLPVVVVGVVVLGRGILGRYLTLPVLALGFLLYLGIALRVVALIRTGLRRPLPPAVPAVLTVGVVALSLIVASQEVRADHGAFPFFRLGGDVEGAEGAVAAINDAAPDGRAVHIILSDRSTIGEATVVVNRLERAGTEVTVPPEWAFVFGERVGPRCLGVVVTFHELDPAKRREQPAPTSETRTTTALAQAYVTVADAGPTPDCPP